MEVYAELIDYLADEIRKVATKPEIKHFDFGYISALKDVRLELMNRFDKEISQLADNLGEKK